MLALAVAGLALSGCSSGGSTPVAAPTTVATVAPTTSTTVSLAALGQQYLAVVAPLNAAVKTFGTAVDALGDNPKAADMQAAADPLIAAERAADEKLLRLPWPANVKADVDSLVTADRALEADLGTASAQNIGTASAWTARVVADEGKVSAAVSIVRADLGLPPSPS